LAQRGANSKQNALLPPRGYSRGNKRPDRNFQSPQQGTSGQRRGQSVLAGWLPIGSSYVIWTDREVLPAVHCLAGLPCYA